ncbi:MAG: hypothetical protein KA100_03245 [Rickettsiales bacterium]|nr:hypothetical protein [Rickettsiales bacterium]
MKKIFLFAFLIFLPPHFALAQMTILNVPSADVAPKKRIFAQHESQFRTKEKGQFVNVTNYLTAGIGNNTELTATYFNLGNLSYNNDTLALGFKTALPLEIDEIKAYQPKLIFGSAAAISLQGNGAGNWTYAAANFTIPQSQTRLTIGASRGNKQIFDYEVTALMLGFEQKITNKLSYVGDWYSGKKNALGIFASALSYNFENDLTLFAGYQVANSKRTARNGFIVEVAKLF